MRTISILAALVLLGSCSIIRVEEEYAGKDTASQERRYETRPGVPFFSKKEICVQTTTWREDLWVIRLDLRDAAGKIVPGSSTTDLEIDTATRKSSEFIHLVDLFMTFHGNPQVNPMPSFSAVVMLEIKKGARQLPASAQFAGNERANQLVVDTSRQFYINGDHPLVGTGTIDFALTPDQTLTKVSGTVEDKTLSTVLERLPIGQLFTEVLGIGKAGETASARGVESGEHWELTIRQQPRFFLISAPCVESSPTSWPWSLDNDGKPSIPENGSFKVVPIGGAPAKGADDKKNGRAIKIEGNVLLPDEKK